MFIFKIRSIVRAGHGGTCLYSQHWERRFPGKEDQQFKASLRYTIGLSLARDTWGQPRIYLYKEHVWECNLMDLEHEEKNVSFDHMLTSARDSRFQACIQILVESILLIGLADRLKTRVYIRTWYQEGKSQRVVAVISCGKLCCAHRPVPEIKGCRRDHDLDKCANHWGTDPSESPLRICAHGQLWKHEAQPWKQAPCFKK